MVHTLYITCPSRVCVCVCVCVRVAARVRDKTAAVGQCMHNAVHGMHGQR